MASAPFPRQANRRPMNRRMFRKANRRRDVPGMVRYGMIPALVSVTKAFNELPAATQQAIRDIAVLSDQLRAQNLESAAANPSSETTSASSSPTAARGGASDG